MSLPPLPPGTILQYMYLKERLRSLKPGRFIEIGCGQGFVSKILLDLGWDGYGYDLNSEAIEKAANLNRDAIQNLRYVLRNESWFESNAEEKVDLIISCLVLEHLDDSTEATYFKRCRQVLKSGGKIILFVPACPAYWGIEDEIAGHYRRYTFVDMQHKLKKFGYQQVHLAGLTYPLSNWLHPLSNWLVKRTEYNKKKMSISQRTRESGNRNVLFKTQFPFLLKLILNEFSLYPFYLFQKVTLGNDKALIMYAEAESD